MRSVLLAIPILAAACGDDPPIEIQGEHFRYVVSEIAVPRNNTEARDLSLDINGDGAIDNQLGMVFGTLESFGLGVSGTVRASVLSGGVIMLADLQSVSLDDAQLAGLTTFLGSDPDPAPCLDPGDLATCGQHLQGTARFRVDADSASALGTAAIVDRRMIASLAELPVEMVFDTAPRRLDLQHARVQLREISAERITAVFAGAITQADFDAVVVPEAHAQIERIVRTECGQIGPDAIPPCGCVDGERAELLQDNFDANNDCAISLEEVANDSVTVSLTAPDVRFGDERMLSLGVGVTLVRAEFDPAAP